MSDANGTVSDNAGTEDEPQMTWEEYQAYLASIGEDPSLYNPEYPDDFDIGNGTDNSTEAERQMVMGMFRIYNSRHDMPEVTEAKPIEICITAAEYQGLLATVGVLVFMMMVVAGIAGVIYKKYRGVMLKNIRADAGSPYSMTTSCDRISTISSTRSFGLSRSINSLPDPNKKYDAKPDPGDINLKDPSEPIYSDPSMFEQSRSLRSVSPSDRGRVMKNGDVYGAF
ncbi:unnamed protein product [Cyprideis torosa]|uniref:Uncharacterized protein n=1 Tax=Cyprideis torosa TaxID=163714 RepID=A0A7R8ZNL5_9CRUS|nr:unnamed protein product [Cyprideis torosa]CAG0891890.1 unnamed protein product [Cyprideis torosa]